MRNSIAGRIRDFGFLLACCLSLYSATNLAKADQLDVTCNAPDEPGTLVSGIRVHHSPGNWSVSFMMKDGSTHERGDQYSIEDTSRPGENYWKGLLYKNRYLMMIGEITGANNEYKYVELQYDTRDDREGRIVTNARCALIGQSLAKAAVTSSITSPRGDARTECKDFVDSVLRLTCYDKASGAAAMPVARSPAPPPAEDIKPKPEPPVSTRNPVSAVEQRPLATMEMVDFMVDWKQFLGRIVTITKCKMALAPSGNVYCVGDAPVQFLIDSKTLDSEDLRRSLRTCTEFNSGIECRASVTGSVAEGSGGPQLVDAKFAWDVPLMLTAPSNATTHAETLRPLPIYDVGDWDRRALETERRMIPMVRGWQANLLAMINDPTLDQKCIEAKGREACIIDHRKVISDYDKNIQKSEAIVSNGPDQFAPREFADRDYLKQHWAKFKIKDIYRCEFISNWTHAGGSDVAHPYPDTSYANGMKPDTFSAAHSYEGLRSCLEYKSEPDPSATVISHEETSPPVPPSPATTDTAANQAWDVWPTNAFPCDPGLTEDYVNSNFLSKLDVLYRISQCAHASAANVDSLLGAVYVASGTRARNEALTALITVVNKTIAGPDLMRACLKSSGIDAFDEKGHWKDMAEVSLHFLEALAQNKLANGCPLTQR